MKNADSLPHYEWFLRAVFVMVIDRTRADIVFDRLTDIDRVFSEGFSLLEYAD